jgi:hypothetical protein
MRFLQILAPWLMVIGLSIQPLEEWFRERTPTSFWFEVISITVSDARVGDEIIMNVVRRIKRSFTATWIVTVRKIEQSGVSVACVSSGTNHYIPDSVLPSPLTLNWWTHPVKCDLPVGRYTLDTVWTINESHSHKQISGQSNVFIITDRP